MPTTILEKESMIYSYFVLIFNEKLTMNPQD